MKRKKLRWPKSVWIKGSEWRIKTKTRLTHPDGTRCDGICDYDNKVIYLSNGLVFRRRLHTFIHEWLHAVFFELHVTDHEGGVGGILEEVLCDGVSAALMEMGEIKFLGARARQRNKVKND